jgi:predicted porin
MKKSLLAVAVLGAFAGAASAQSSVTVYGSIDAGIRNVTNVNAAGDDLLTMSSNGTFNSNRLGFKGVEDLGGGMNAHFTLESGFNNGTGTLDNAANRLFNRSAFVGIGGAWGSIDLGRQYSVNFKTIGLYDAFGYKYPGIIPLAGQGGLTRFDNDIQYTGTFGPVTVRAEYALGEVAGSNSNGASQAIGASYSAGGITVGGAYTQRKLPNGTPAAFRDNKNWTVGGAFKATAFSVAAGYAKNTQENAPTIADTDVKTAWLSGSFNFSPAAALTAGYYQVKTTPTNAKNELLIVGATYALSKRTNFYADIDRRKIKPANTKQTGLSVGINHLF